MVLTYIEGETQLYQEEVVYRCKFKSTINLNYIIFYEKGEGKVGPRLVQQKQESE